MDTVAKAARYPLQGSVLLAIIAYVLCMALARMAFLFGIPLAWFTMIGAVGYMSIVFRGCANGRERAPTFSANEANMFGSASTLRLLMFFVLAAAVAWHIARIDDVRWLIVLAITWGFFFPAALALVVLNDSLTEAFHGERIAELVVTMGGGYLALPAAALVGALTLQLLTALSLPGLLDDVATGYIVIATLAFWGFQFHRYADDIGLDPTSDEVFRQNLIEKDEQHTFETAMDEAYAESRTDSDRALATVQSLFAGDNDTLQTRERAFERVREWPNAMVSLRLAQDLITRYLALGRDDQALALVDYGLSRNNAFRPAGPNATLRAASLALKQARPKIATSLLSDFGERFCDHPQRVSAAMTGATIALERTNETALARRLFEDVAKDPMARQHPRYTVLREALSTPAGSRDNAS